MDTVTSMLLLASVLQALCIASLGYYAWQASADD